MAALSNYLENELLDMILRSEAWSEPSSVWIGLWTADDGLESGTLTSEVSGGSYAREEVGGGSGLNFTVASAGSSDNAQKITFTTATASWGIITHVAIMDASTSGNVLFHGALSSSVTISNGDTFEFDVGDLTCTLD